MLRRKDGSRGAPRRIRLVHILISAVLAFPRASSGAVLPPGFAEEMVTSGLKGTTSIEFAPDGRLFVAEKQGNVWIVKNGARLPVPFIDLRDEVHNAADKGLVGLAIDPAFASNGWVYLLYGVDPQFGQPDESGDAVTIGRLTRYTANGDVADLGSRHVILGNGAGDGFPQCTKIHGVGTIRFAHDGTLFVGAGDGAWADRVDLGQDVTAEDPDCAAMFGAAQDVGAARSQLLTSYAGKILRIDPATGRGLPTNPFWDGDPDSPASKIWVLGLRNPFRFSVKPGSEAPGTLVISEVGWSSWEEIDVAHAGGENFGWPCREGTGPQPLYDADPRSDAWCDGTFAGTPTDPALMWHHEEPGILGFTGFASTGNVYYDRPEFPAAYRDGLFFCDFGGGWIRFARLDSQDRVLSVEGFAFGVVQPVDLAVDPQNGDLLYVSMGPGRVYRVSFAAGNVPPNAQAAATPPAGPAPLTVAFSSSGTSDANGDPMTFAWDFGDGSPISAEPNPTHVYPSLGAWDATLIVRDSAALADTAIVTVETRNTPPELTIVHPPHGYRFQIDELIPLEAIANDREDGAAVDMRWEVQLVHNAHIHPEWFVWDGPNPPFFEAEEHAAGLGDRYSYRVIATATDGDGLATTREAFLIPQSLPSNEAPVALAQSSLLTGSSPLPVYFDGTQSSDPDGDVLFPRWEFGDGTSSTEIAPAHVYGGFGERIARLTVTDVVLASGSTELTVLVLPGRTLACHWPFEEGGGMTAIDASGHAHDATITGAVVADGALGWAYRFDGFGDRVSLATPILDERPRFTLAAWIAPDVMRAGAGIVGQRGAIALGFVAADSIGIVTGFGGEARAHYRYRTGEWHHVAAIGDGTSLKLAIDGVIVATGGASTFSYGLTSDPVQVGAESIIHPQSPAFTGVIDEVRIYDDALTDEEILFLGSHPRINRAPYVHAGDDRELVIGQTLHLQGSVEDDGLPGAAVAHAWTQVEGPEVAIEDAAALALDLLPSAPGTYVFRLEAFDGALGSEDEVTIAARLYGQATALEGAPRRHGVEAIAPNPTRGDASIHFGVMQGRPRVQVAIADLAGRRVAHFPTAQLETGRYRIDWNGCGDDGQRVAAGVYFAVVDVGVTRTSEKIVVLR